jgi:hypothetical protein
MYVACLTRGLREGTERYLVTVRLFFGEVEAA